ncbi:hypothetical protein [Planctomicrobium sp. SH527]|uniref:hypothetical protein n=1 Tax=Planctomicrobium sp. SH527 TaxID=3448123 RepID=UPI003F5AF948
MSNDPTKSSSDSLETDKKNISETDPPTSSSAQQVGAEDDLPDYEELTPEFLEDECIRGDFMLRWAVILLAVLLGSVLITESRLFVSIRSGEYMLSNGILPPRVDVFSATADGRPWANLGWMSDLILAATSSVLGFTGLSILCAATVGLSWWCLSKITIPGVTTWWGSICSLLALLALIPVFQPGATTITILGMTLLLWWLWSTSRSESLQHPWTLLVLMALWANLDSRSWIGLFALGLYAIGLVATSSGRSAIGRPRLMWIGGAIVAGAVVSPWPLRPLTQFLTAFREEAELIRYQGISEHFVRLSTYGLPAFWKSIDLFSFMALALVAFSFMTILLNRKRQQLGLSLLWLGINALGFFFAEAIAYAAIVNAVVATLNGQEWFHNRFGNDYSITTWNVLSSRVGRAIQVLTIFVLAYLSLNGALMGPQSRRIGLGLDPRWKNRIDSLEQEVLPNASSDRIFPTTPNQGDILIWAGKKPFVDSRLSLYFSGKENLLFVHQKTRAELFPSRDRAADAAAVSTWKSTLERFNVNDVLVRLWSPKPAYGPFFQLYTNENWALTGLGSAGGIFTRNDISSPELKAHVEKVQLKDFAKIAFQPAVPPEPVEIAAVWPLPVSRYDKWLIQKLDVVPPAAELASHYTSLVVNSAGFTAVQVSGLSLLAIQNCRKALSENPNHPLAYRTIGTALGLLLQAEAVAAGQQIPSETIRSQILTSAFSTAIASDEDPSDLLTLFQQLLNGRSIDTALEVLNRYDIAMTAYPEIKITAERKLEFDRTRKQLSDAVDAVQKQMDDAKSKGASPMDLAVVALGGNCPGLALKALEADMTKVISDPEMQLFYATLLLQNGRIENALEQVEGVGARLKGPQGANASPMFKKQWEAVTKLVYLSAMNLDEFVKLSDTDENGDWVSGLRGMLQLPFLGFQLPLQLEFWPAFQSRLAVAATIDVAEQWAVTQLGAARAELELGKLDAAKVRLQKIATRHPQFSQRPVVAMYLDALTGSKYQFPEVDLSEPDWITKFNELSKLKPATPAVESQPESKEKKEESEKPKADETPKPAETPKPDASPNPTGTEPSSSPKADE